MIMSDISCNSSRQGCPLKPLSDVSKIDTETWIFKLFLIFITVSLKHFLIERLLNGAVSLSIFVYSAAEQLDELEYEGSSLKVS